MHKKATIARYKGINSTIVLLIKAVLRQILDLTHPTTSGSVFQGFDFKTIIVKKENVILFLFCLLAVTSCQVIGDIFSAGVYTGIFLVVVVVVAIVMIFSKLRRRK